MDRSLQLARQRGVDWLFHIDDDELLHFDVPFATMVSAPLPYVRCALRMLSVQCTGYALAEPALRCALPR